MKSVKNFRYVENLHQRSVMKNNICLSSYVKIELFSQAYDARQPVELP